MRRLRRRQMMAPMRHPRAAREPVTRGRVGIVMPMILEEYWGRQEKVIIIDYYAHCEREQRSVAIS